MEDTTSHKALIGWAMAAIIIIGLFVLLGAHVASADAEIATACIEAGKTWVDGNCQ